MTIIVRDIDPTTNLLPTIKNFYNLETEYRRKHQNHVKQLSLILLWVPLHAYLIIIVGFRACLFETCYT